MVLFFAAIALPVYATNRIDVMTFNLRYASATDGVNNWINSIQAPDRRQVVLRVLQQHNPDLVGFQEGENTQLDYLTANLPAYSFERRKPSGGGGNENAAFAWKTNAVELLDRGVFSLGPSPGGSYWNNHPGTNFNPYIYFPDMGLNFPRIALWGKFRWKSTGQEFLFYTTHYDFNNTPQVRGSHLIADDAQNRNARMPMSPLAIVVGDFNSSHLNDAWKFYTGTFYTNGITGDFIDSWYQAVGSWNNSGTLHGYNGGTPPESERIDWILHRGGFSALSADIIHDSATATNLSNGSTRNQFPSDHYPVKARLQFPSFPPDYDRDGIPDAAELTNNTSMAVDPDTDNDLLLDGQENLNANGYLDGGETDPQSPNDPAQQPTDIRNYQMNGVRDFSTTLLAVNGLELWTAFDGRYLYVATQDAGEGNDHFIFICTNHSESVNAPWAKFGQVSRWLAFLADEDGGTFSGWFNASANLITNLFTARSSVYYENGGRLEGVIDLAQFLAPGFTTVLYIAAAPYGTADGGTLVQSAQVPSGNGDGNILGVAEYVLFNPGDDDGDGINNAADPDRDGDGLPDAWESAYKLTGHGDDDPDGDHSENRHELASCTNPTNADSVFEIKQSADNTFSLEVPLGKTTTVWKLVGSAYNPAGAWQIESRYTNNTIFPSMSTSITIALDAHYIQFSQSPD